MTSYLTYPRQPGAVPRLTPVQFEIASARMVPTDYVGDTLTLDLTNRRNPVAFRVALSAALAEPDSARFMAEIGATNPRGLSGRLIIGQVDRETGSIYALTPSNLEPL